jgi:hypothetical protein
MEGRMIMTDVNGTLITEGAYVKYSFNEIKIPVFSGRIVTITEELHVEHCNKVVVKIDDSIKYIEIIKW